MFNFISGATCVVMLFAAFFLAHAIRYEFIQGYMAEILVLAIVVVSWIMGWMQGSK